MSPNIHAHAHAHASSSARSPHRRARRDQSSSSTTSSAFFISDSSPLIQYGAEGSSSATPWTAGYALQTDGYDETLHLTSTSNSTISFNITSTSLTLLIPSFTSCSATLTLNTSTPIPACASNTSGTDSPYTVSSLPLGTHHVTWNSGVIPSGEQVIFWGVDGSRPGETGTNVTVDNTFAAGAGAGVVGMEYAGQGWTALGSGAGVQTSLSEASTLTYDFNKTLAITQTQGDSVTFSGTGSAIYLYGTVGPEYSLAEVTLNGEIVAPSMNLSSPWPMSYELLWFRTGLDSTALNNVTLKNLESKKMALDFVILTADTDTLAQLNTVDDSDPFVSSLAGKLILFLAVPLLAIFIIGAFTWYLISRRRSRRKAARDSTVSLRPSLGGSGSEKKRGVFTPYVIGSLGGGTTTSGRSTPTPSIDEVFVSYDEGRGQRLSDRWYSSPTTSDSQRSTSTPRSALPALATVPESVQSTHSTSPHSDRDERIKSLMGSQYATTNYPDSRRGTALPAYTPEGTYVSQYVPSELSGGVSAAVRGAENVLETMSNGGTTVSGGGTGNGGSPGASPSSRYPSAEEEKAAQLRIFRDIANSSPPPPPPAAGPSHTGHGASFLGDYAFSDDHANRLSGNRLSTATAAPSDIMSVFGAPPASERRFSTLTDHTTGTNHMPWLSRPGSAEGYPPPLPTTTSYPGFLGHGSGLGGAPALSSSPAGAGSTTPSRPTVVTDFLGMADKNPFNLPYMSSPATSSAHPGGSASTLLSDKFSSTLGSTIGAALGLGLGSRSEVQLMEMQRQAGAGASAGAGAGGAVGASPASASKLTSPPSAWSASASGISPHTKPTPATPDAPGVPAPSAPGTGEMGYHKRSQSNYSERSAARPDSDVMPFESFIHSLNAAAKEEAEREGRA
ncbi:hypothetical protein IAT38_003267 [Cryptococcus sp. DSM 104549]